MFCFFYSQSGIGHIPPFGKIIHHGKNEQRANMYHSSYTYITCLLCILVPLAVIKIEYDSCGTTDSCENWFYYPTNGYNILKSELDKIAHKYFGNVTQIKFPGPEDSDSTTYYHLEYIDQGSICNNNCLGPHYCKPDVVPVSWGDFCPYVQTGANSSQYRYPHIALTALGLWITDQCMPYECPVVWLDSPNGQGYAGSNEMTISIVWAKMEKEYDLILRWVFIPSQARVYHADPHGLAFDSNPTYRVS